MSPIQSRRAMLFLAVCTLLVGLSSTGFISVDRPLDQDTAATDHHYGRVHIKVFRGPGPEHHFAPHGYWVKQPADDDHHH